MTDFRKALTVDDVLDEEERFIEEIRQFTADQQEGFVQRLKQEADRLIQVDIDRCRKFGALICRLSEQTGQPAHLALGLLVEANALSIGLGQYPAAVEIYDRAASVLGANGLYIDQAKALIGKLYALGNLGRYEEALADGEWARKILRDNQVWFHLARLKVNLAIVYGRLGEDEKALELLDLAQQAYAQLGVESELNQLRVMMNRAHILRNLGRFDEAIETSQAVYEAHQKLGRRQDAARAQQALALTYFVLGRYNEALALLDQVRETFLLDGRQRNALLVELFISDCLLQLRRFQEALEKCQTTREGFQSLGSRYEVGQSTLNEAVAYTGLKKYAEARASLEQARLLFEQEGNQVAIAETDLQAAGVQISLDAADEALDLALSCAEVFAAHNLPNQQAQAHLIAARAAMALPGAANSSEQTASREIQRALEIGRRLNLPAVNFLANYLHGQLAVRLGQSERGLEDYAQAIEELECLCGRMMTEFRSAFIEDKETLYEDAVELCIHAHLPEQALNFAERARSRALLDLVAHRIDLSIRPRSPNDDPIVEELLLLQSQRDRLYRTWESEAVYGFRGDSGQRGGADPETQQKIISLEKRITGLWHRLLVLNADYARDASLWQVRSEPVQPYLDENCLLLEYFTIHQELVVFLASRDSIRCVRLGANLPQVQKLMQYLWLNLRTVPGASPERLEALIGNSQGVLRQLYKLLIEPVEADIAGARRLIIVPHRSLHYLSFQALFDGKEYLLEKAEVSYLPGSSMLCYARRPNPPGEGILVAGNSYQGRLPYTLEEAKTIARIWGSSAFLEEEASLQTIRQSAPQARVLHLATHGAFRDDNPLFSGLALADGWLTTLDIFNLKLKASLVTLSACQTGRSVVGGGDELFGLMRAFLVAGAASLVATLWTVEDRSTAQLMERFYQSLVDGQSKSAALRSAQLHFLGEDAPPQYRHPYFWAPFFLVGDAGAL